MSNKKRVALIAHSWPNFGGIQTCFLELINGLNRFGIVPEILWDEPTNWEALGNPVNHTVFSGGRLLLSSKRMRSLPSWLQYRLKPINDRLAKFKLTEYDFVYSFEPGITMKQDVPNICYTAGPPLIQVPTEDHARKTIRSILSQITTIPYRIDDNSRYVTISDWIAKLFLHTHHFEPPVIWPPARTRNSSSEPLFEERNGFLFLSRIESYKRPEIVLRLARNFKQYAFTIAGAVYDNNMKYVNELKAQISDEHFHNVHIVENPSEHEVTRLFQTHKYFVFPAKWEHFGIVTVEAILAGLVPIVHNTGGQVEIVPIDSLRFNDDQDLIEKVNGIISLKEESSKEMVEYLKKHTARSLPENYQKEMLKPLKETE